MSEGLIRDLKGSMFYSNVLTLALWVLTLFKEVSTLLPLDLSVTFLIFEICVLKEILCVDTFLLECRHLLFTVKHSVARC